MSAKDDKFLAEYEAKCAKAMAQWLKSTLNLKREIGTLDEREMRGIARVAIDIFIVEVSNRRDEPDAELIHDLYLAG